MTAHARIDENGRLGLSTDLLERNGLGLGLDVTVEETSEGLMIRRPVSQALRDAQEWSRKLMEGRAKRTVDDFLVERRESIEGE